MIIYMNPLHGAIAGVTGNILYQLVMIYDFRKAKGYWPWKDEDADMTTSAYIFGSVVKVIVAAFVSGAFVHLGQVDGIWAAGITGIASDQILKTAGSKMIKEAKNEA